MAKAAGTSLINWEKQLMADAQLAVAVEQNTGLGNFVGTRGGILKIAGSPVPGNTVPVVIADHISAKLYYEGDFDEDNPSSPVCYAYAHVQPDGSMPEMKPHPESAKPQSPTCKECKWDAFKTDKRGKGKACKDVRRLAIIHADSLKDAAAVRKTQVLFANVPVTSVAGWANYVRSLANVMKRPPYAVVTKLSLVPDEKTQFKMTFEPVEKVTASPLLAELSTLHKRMETDIMFPYPEQPEGAAKPKGKGAAAAKKNKFGRK